jgi:hypothetical protein
MKKGRVDKVAPAEKNGEAVPFQTLVEVSS